MLHIAPLAEHCRHSADIGVHCPRGFDAIFSRRSPHMHACFHFMIEDYTGHVRATFLDTAFTALILISFVCSRGGHDYSATCLLQDDG